MICNMGRSVVLLLVASAFACLLAAGAGAVDPSKLGPTLRLVDDKPLVLRGAGFKAREAVRLTVKAGSEKRVRNLVATRTGTFQVVFPRLRVDPCELEARAAGRTGIAAYKLPERMCPIPLGP